MDLTLASLRLGQYAQALKAQGLRDDQSLHALDPAELQRAARRAGMSPGHATRFLWHYHGEVNHPVSHQRACERDGSPPVGPGSLPAVPGAPASAMPKRNGARPAAAGGSAGRWYEDGSSEPLLQAPGHVAGLPSRQAVAMMGSPLHTAPAVVSSGGSNSRQAVSSLSHPPAPRAKVAAGRKVQPRAVPRPSDMQISRRQPERSGVRHFERPCQSDAEIGLMGALNTRASALHAAVETKLTGKEQMTPATVAVLVLAIMVGVLVGGFCFAWLEAPEHSHQAGSSIRSNGQDLPHFECQVGLQSLQASWSEERRQFCCREEKVACKQPVTASEKEGVVITVGSEAPTTTTTSASRGSKLWALLNSSSTSRHEGAGRAGPSTDLKVTTTAAAAAAGHPAAAAEEPLLQNDSLWCFTLVQPGTSEVALVGMQHKQKKGIFGCDGWAVYSNPSISIGGEDTRLVTVDTHAEMGNVTIEQDDDEKVSFQTAFNTPIFKQLWAQVVSEGDFGRYAWTVKADPDTVFLPAKLRSMLRGPDHANAVRGHGLWLNNCKLGLHGPLEVMSRRALRVYGAGYTVCEAPPEEDVYLEKCLDFLGVQRLDQFDLLADKLCYRGKWQQSPYWFTCESGNAAFHPFKTEEAWKACLANAEKQEGTVVEE